MRQVLIAAVMLGCVSAHALDSRCQEASPDCEGEDAARRPWVVSEHGDLWLETRQLAALPEALDAPFLVRTAVIACPSTVSVERAGTHVIASLTTTSLPPAGDGGYLEGGVAVFIGPGEASRVAFTRSDTIPAPFGNLVNATRFPGGTLDFGDPGLTIQEFQVDLTGTVDVAAGEAVLFETGFEFQFHEESVSLADAVLLDLELLPQ